MFLLDEACRPIHAAFGGGLYLVGTAAALDRQDYRDVDVRLILDDAAYDALVAATSADTVSFLGLAIGEYLVSRTGLPIDFQIQRQTEANERHKGIRNPVGFTRTLANYRGDASPEPAPIDGIYQYGI
jgi:hypothetical protein